MSRTLGDIDALLAEPKSLFGIAEWVEDGPVASLRAPVADARGVVMVGVTLHLSATIELSPQRGDAVLTVDGGVAERMAIRPGKAHVNPDAWPVPVGLRRRRLPPGRSRLYRWRDNRQWPRLNPALAAVTIDEPQGLSAAFERFVEGCAITAYLPQAPWRARLDLP